MLSQPSTTLYKVGNQCEQCYIYNLACLKASHMSTVWKIAFNSASKPSDHSKDASSSRFVCLIIQHVTVVPTLQGMIDTDDCVTNYADNTNSSIEFSLINGDCNMRRSRMVRLRLAATVEE